MSEERPEIGFKKKRARTADNKGEYYLPYPQESISGESNPHLTAPSRVVHVREVADEAREQNLIEILEPFGKIR